ncbi:WYL domain-containing protein [Desulfobulbus rhabdoformis]|uniref:helix-turn-helix transcriptional regulator n=1 Tax=Desulfobulbus rhabdoformis TaxID=34032 RepID=UPI001964616C|nr:WYL domain-containing protein [Desulfobulbus rhabdoformis]MBM9616701.1 WYL domain-containing protein [Desulfobulbus rhabdoformis]
MPKNKLQHARLLFIDRQIREKHFPNCAGLAAEWEVNPRTIRRDLDYLRYELDAPLAYSASKRGFYYTEEQYQLPALQMRERDLFALFLADKLLAQYEGTPIYDSLRSVFKKIEHSLPDKISLSSSSDQSLFTVIPPSSTVIVPEVLELIFAALRSAEQVQIVYQSPGAQPQKRLLDPYHCVRYEGDWYVLGFCHLRRALRTFSLARILSVQTTAVHFSRPEDLDFQVLFTSHFGIHWGEGTIEVALHFSPSAATYIRERTWHPSQRIDEQKDGSSILTMRVNHLLELKRWILSWGPAVQVLAPQQLIDEIQADILKMQHNYQG